jgi:acyl-CoA thioesterase-1
MVAKALPLLLLTALAWAGGCDRDKNGAPAAPAAAARPTEPATRAAKLPRVVFLGDSLTAGLGVDQEQAVPAVVGQMLEAEGRPVVVVNAGVSGDTTAGGLRRLDWLLRQKPDVVVVGLGANDGLRGLKLEASEQNLRDIVAKSRDAGARVLVLGMLIPPNYGPEYASQFRELYPRLAKELKVGLVPFLLEGVGGEPRLNQPDGIHPTPEGHRLVAQNVLPHLRPLIQSSAN